jgi:uncharacterized protein YukE
MALEGMDVEVVTGIAHQMNGLCGQLEQINSTMMSLVHQLEGAWQGPDAQQFAAQWPSHQSQLQVALTGLQGLTTHVQTNLSQQEQVSNTY